MLHITKNTRRVDIQYTNLNLYTWMTKRLIHLHGKIWRFNTISTHDPYDTNMNAFQTPTALGSHWKKRSIQCVFDNVYLSFHFNVIIAMYVRIVVCGPTMHLSKVSEFRVSNKRNTLRNLMEVSRWLYLKGYHRSEFFFFILILWAMGLRKDMQR